METERTLKWGIAGCGKISSDFCTALKIEPSHHEVVAVAARELNHAQQFAEKFGVKQAFGGYDKLITCDEIDVVYIGTINTTHFDLCKTFINAGKNILCEKPMTLSHTQTTALTSLAKEKKVFFMEGFWTRFFPAYQRMLSEIRSSRIGVVKMITIDFGFDMINKERVSSVELGGGILYDLGCYGVQLIQNIMSLQGASNGRPEKITAVGQLHHTGVDICETVTLQYPNQAMAVISLHAGIALRNSATIYGSKGTIQMLEFWHPETILVNNDRITIPLPHSADKMVYPSSEGFIYEAEHVRECILKGLTESPLMPTAASEEIAYVMTEARKQLGVEFNCD